MGVEVSKEVAFKVLKVFVYHLVQVVCLTLVELAFDNLVEASQVVESAYHEVELETYLVGA